MLFLTILSRCVGSAFWLVFVSLAFLPIIFKYLLLWFGLLTITAYVFVWYADKSKLFYYVRLLTIQHALYILYAAIGSFLLCGLYQVVCENMVQSDICRPIKGSFGQCLLSANLYAFLPYIISIMIMFITTVLLMFWSTDLLSDYPICKYSHWYEYGLVIVLSCMFGIMWII